MNAAQLLDRVNALGARIETEDGRARVRGAKLPPEMMTQIKALRDDLIAEVDRRKRDDRDRYGKVPPHDAPMLAHDLQLADEAKDEVIEHVMRQPRPVHGWVMLRANAYYLAGVAQDDCDWHACIDVIAWQRDCDGRRAAEFVMDMKAAAPAVAKPEPKESSNEQQQQQSDATGVGIGDDGTQTPS